MATTLVLLSASCVSSNKSESFEKTLATNESINVIKTTKIVLNEEQQKSFPIENASQFCNGAVSAYLLQSTTEIDFDAIQKSSKLSKKDVFKTKDPFFITKLNQFLFPQKPALEQSLILCHPPLEKEHLDKISDELKLNGIFVLFSDELSSKDHPKIFSFFKNAPSDDEKTETETNKLCTAILCESFGCIDSIRLKIGCADTELLEVYAPNSWRFAFRDNNYDFVQTSDLSLVPSLDSQRTLALIKPTAVSKGFAEDIISEIKANGFCIISQKRIHLKVEHAKYFYKEHEGKVFFDELTEFMSSGPIYALILERIGAIKCWRTMLGPTNTFTAKEKAPNSIRAKYGTNQTANACHGSDSLESAKREIKFYFPEMNASANDIKQSKNVVEEYMLQKLANKESLKDFLVRGLSELAKQKPESKLMAVKWFGDWLISNNPNKPQIEEPKEDDEYMEKESFVQQCKVETDSSKDVKIVQEEQAAVDSLE